ncbi:MAG: AAA family ATPase [Cryomorphaceae bacterium]|nr:AAA family ATPase [Cryomorphaceae bacterium]
MIIQFTVGNFLSFNSKMTLDMKAKGISELKKNIVLSKSDKILRSAVIYGANSSGKSNFIRAFGRMRTMLLTSVNLNSTDELDYTPFLLSSESEHAPTFFELVFWHKSLMYRYGFEYTLNEVRTEWLFQGKTANSEKPLFIRSEEEIVLGSIFNEGKDNPSRTNSNRLFVSLVAQLGGAISNEIIEFFKSLNVISGVDHLDYRGFTLKMIHKKLRGHEESLKMFQNLKLGFQNVEAVESDFNSGDIPGSAPEFMKTQWMQRYSGTRSIKLKTEHKKFDGQGRIIGTVWLDNDENESEGTKKVIDLSGPIFDTLINGKILIIDELDAKLHPLITMHIVQMFNDPELNQKNAQLIFATHDTNLLGEDLFRRDQIWFTEKDDQEQTDLYSLYDFNLPNGVKVRNDANLERNYIRGRYGAIPFITNNSMYDGTDEKN